MEEDSDNDKMTDQLFKSVLEKGKCWVSILKYIIWIP